MAGSPKKRARKEAIADGTHKPQATQRRDRGARVPTEAETAEIVSLLETPGGLLETAWALVGVNRDTGREWLDKGRRQPDGPYGDHARRVAAAREIGIALLHDQVRAAGDVATLEEITYDGDGNVTKRRVKQDRGDWRANAWALERIDPSRFMARVRLELEGELSSVFAVLEGELDPATFARVLEALAKVGTAESPV